MVVDPRAASRRRFLADVAAAAGFTGLLGALAACTSDNPAAQPSTSPAPSSSGAELDVTSFGAVGDGHTDDSDAIERALRALRPGGTLVFPANKVFQHSRVIAISTPNASILGPGRLVATAEQTSAVRIEADGVTVRGLSLGITATTQRWSAPDQHKLYLGPRERIVVQDVSIDGSAAAGLFCYGTSQLQLRGVRVSDTRADGIHMTNGCHDVRIESPVTSATGDDAIAVVSYLSDAKPCRNIVVRDADVRSTTGGRGMSVVGGDSVVYENIEIDGSNAAGLYIACEGGDFVTYPVNDVTVTGGRISGANTNAAIDHGSVLVYSGRDGGSVTAVMISDLTVTATRSSATRQIGVIANDPAATVSDITFSNLTLDTEPTPYEGNAPVDAITLRSVRSGGTAVHASVTP